MSLADFSLKGKRALVVGGRRNMGKGFALGLAEAGADVAVTDLKMEDGRLSAVAEEIEQMGRRSLRFKVTSVPRRVSKIWFLRWSIRSVESTYS